MIKAWPNGYEEDVIDIVVAVATDPQGKPRPRFTSGGRAYTPADFVEWSQKLSRELGKQLGGVQFRGPVRLDAVFVADRPAYMKKVYKRTGEPKFPPGLLPYVQKPDRDNFDKALMDALQFAVQYHQWYSKVLYEKELPYLIAREEENLRRAAEKKKPLTKDPFPKTLRDQLFEEFLENSDEALWADDAVVWCGTLYKVFCELDDSGPLPLAGRPRILARLRNELPCVESEVDDLLFGQS